MSFPPSSNENGSHAGRRDFLQSALLATGGAALLAAGCNPPAANQVAPIATGSGQRPLRCAFTNAGLKHTWCSRGQETAKLWGKLLGIDIVWIDGESDLKKQRDKIDRIVSEDWDFCCFQSVEIDNLAEPVRRLKERKIPVISIDQYLVEKSKLKETGVWCHVSADQEFMGATSTQYIMDKIGGKGRVIHIGGPSAHSGAQGRARGFDRVVKNYPNVEVFGGLRWCKWEQQLARDTFEALLGQSTDQPIVGAFFHNDDMALACVPALENNALHKGMILAGVDGQDDGLGGVRDKKLGCTAINPACRLHFLALAVGMFIVRNQETIESVPTEIIAPTTRVSLDDGSLDAAYYQANVTRCLF